VDRTTPWLGRLALLLAVVHLASVLAVLAHTAAEVHVRCAEHGDVVHAGTAPEGQPPTLLAELDVLRSGGGAEGGEHHEHCRAATATRAALAEPPGLTSCRTATVEQVAAAGEAPAPAGTPRYRLAPKQSPPHLVVA
jgi:hypothetical protein